MKKIVLSIFFIALLAISWTTVKHGFGSIGGFTGSPTDGDNCTTCHPQNIKAAGWWVYPIGMSANGFIPGDIVTIYLFAEQDGMRNAGFEMTAEDSQGNKIGQFMITDSTQTRLTNKGSVTHTGDGHETSSGLKTWMVDLYIPHSAPDTFKLYTAFNSNNGGYGIADTTRLSTYKFFKSPTGRNNNVALELELSCYPNPCSEILYIQTSTTYNEIRVYDLNGKLIMKTDAKKSIDIQELEKGSYFIQVMSDEKSHTQKILKI